MQIRPARPEDYNAKIPKLIWDEDAPLMACEYGTYANWCAVVAAEWPAPHAFTSHAITDLALQNGAFAGFVTGFPAADYESLAEGSDNLRSETSNPRAHLLHLDQLFPVPPQDAYYVLNIATDPAHLGRGVGRALLQCAVGKARAIGCTSLCLDVAAENPAVGFYQHLGLSIAVETRLPALQSSHGVGLHYHMHLAL
jgi:ribosomal protein S18 acetylase RimI-like enzyme